MSFELITILPPDFRSPRIAEGWVTVRHKDHVGLHAITRLNGVRGCQRVFPVSATSGSEAVYLPLEAREARRTRDARSCVVSESDKREPDGVGVLGRVVGQKLLGKRVDG